MKVVTQDPEERLDYEFEFAALLPDGDEVTTFAVTADDPDVTVDDVTLDAEGVVHAFATGGTVGTTVELKCVANTQAGRTLVRRTSILLRYR